MASAFLSILRLTERLSAPIQRLFRSSSPFSLAEEEVGKDLEKLGRTLLRIEAVLNDAEEREIIDQSVKLWLNELKSVAHDAEDVLDEFEFELLRSKMEHDVFERTRKRKNQVRDVALPLQNHLIQRIREIRERFDEIENSRRDLQLREEDGVRSEFRSIAAPPTVGLVDESVVYGREEDKENVLNLLLSEHQSREDLPVVSIVGMKGIGKSTLAQLVYEDDRVQDHFDLLSWVSVSIKFDVIELTKAIIVSVTEKRCELDELSTLQEIVRDEMMDKRFLLVLDDVWNENAHHWEILIAPLTSGSRGSRILITTQNENASRTVRAIASYRLGPLTDGDCWRLFSQYAFGGRNPEEHSHLAAIGRKIIQKCEGLPFTVKTLGGLLCSETDEDCWNDVLGSEMWHLDVNCNFSALTLGYQYLPASLKQCLAYCAVFPKCYQFGKDQLVRMWMAQCFIQTKGRIQMEDTGGEYFDDLLRRSFFQHSFDGSDSQQKFTMHDLIYDIAQSTWGKDCYKFEDGKSCIVSRNLHHSTIICYRSERLVPCELTYDPKALRTLFLISRSDNPLDLKVLDDLFSRLKYLRVLDLSDANIDELPESTGNLKHMRYLGLNRTKLWRLPETVCSLYNLQTLDLQGCHDLVKLPEGIGNLINLRHLNLGCDIMDTKISMMPSGIGRLTSIQTLPVFVVGKGSGCAGVLELGELKYIRGEICILGLQNVVYGKHDAGMAKLKDKEYLDKLHLQWSGEGVVGSNLAKQAEDVLENLQPHPNIKDLKLCFYKGNQFPKWLGNRSFSRLLKVTLVGCCNCTCLPPLGQLPLLKFLFVHNMIKVKCVGREIHGKEMVQGRSFPSLEKLCLYNMPELESWLFGAEEEGYEFCCLQQLTIHDCPKLTSISLHNLKALKKLEIWDCAELTSITCLNNYLKVQQRNHKDCLESLELLRCPKLAFSPENQLPTFSSDLQV